MWCVTSDKILIVDVASSNCKVLQKLYNYDKLKMPTIFECALQVSEEEVWVAAKSSSVLFIWNTKTITCTELELKPEDIRITCMIKMLGMVWVGNYNGKVFIMNPKTRKIERTLHAHTDLVKSMCVTREGHVITGSSSKEGKLCVWNAMYDLDVIDGKRKAHREDFEFVDKMRLPSPLEGHFLLNP